MFREHRPQLKQGVRRSWFVLIGLFALSIAPLLLNITLGPGAPGWLLFVTLLLAADCCRHHPSLAESPWWL